MAKKLSKARAQLMIRRAAKAGRVMICSQDGIQQFDYDLVSELLEKGFEIGGALLTDESAISDFLSFGSDAEAREKQKAHILANIKKHFDVDASGCVYMLDVLRLIEARRASTIQ